MSFPIHFYYVKYFPIHFYYVKYYLNTVKRKFAKTIQFILYVCLLSIFITIRILSKRSETIYLLLWISYSMSVFYPLLLFFKYYLNAAKTIYPLLYISYSMSVSIHLFTFKYHIGTILLINLK